TLCMAQFVTCPECKKTLQVPEELLGQNVQCPECKQTFIASVEAIEGRAGAAVSTTPPMPAPLDMGEEERRPRQRRRDYDVDEDDEDDLPSRRPIRRGHFMPHRGGMILAFGIIGLVALPVLGVVAWVMGNNDLSEMQAGRMDPTGESMT